MNSNIYWERQSGDLCRLHSINAYFGFKKLNKSDKYFEVLKKLFNFKKKINYYFRLINEKI